MTAAIALLLGGAIGWGMHALVVVSDASDVSSLEKSTADTIISKSKPAYSPARMSAHAKSSSDSLECEVDDQELVAELARLQFELGACQGGKVSWPDELDPNWSAESFRSRMSALMQRLDISGELEFYCEEFPCIARFPDATDWVALKSAVQEEYGGSSDVDVKTMSHGIVGEFGRRNLWFVSIAPSDHMDGFARERLDDRISEIIQSAQKDLKREHEESEREDG